MPYNTGRRQSENVIDKRWVGNWEGSKPGTDNWWVNSPDARAAVMKMHPALLAPVQMERVFQPLEGGMGSEHAQWEPRGNTYRYHPSTNELMRTRIPVSPAVE